MSSTGQANWHEFTEKAFELNLGRALGLQADGTFKGGLIAATVIELPVGIRLCRIANTSLPARMNLSSPWWVREEVFVSFLRSSLALEKDVIDVIRDSLALSDDFMTTNERADAIRARYGDDALQTYKNFASIEPWDRVFTAEVTAVLCAFTGIGRDVTDTLPGSPLGTARTWRAAKDVAQLFIPGLLDPSDRGLSETGKAALHFRRSLSLAHWREWILDDLAHEASRGER